MSTIRESEEWDGKAPWNPQWFWPQAILFGFGAAGIVAGLNYRRLGRSRLIWPTIVISSVVFIGVLAGLAFVDRGYVAVTAIIINAPAALILFLLQRADYNSFKERMSNGVSGGLDLPVMIGLPWRLWFCWRSLSLFRLKTRLKKSHRLRNKSRKAWTGLAKVTLSVLFPVLTRPLNSRLRWLRPTISEARLTAYWISANRLFKTSMMRSGSILKTRRSSFLGGCHWMFLASINVPSQTMMRPSGSTLTMEWRATTARSFTPVWAWIERPKRTPIEQMDWGLILRSLKSP